MKMATFAGHPLHPQLILLPAGLLPFSTAMDVAHLATGRQSYADAGYYGLMGGVVGGLAAGAAGAADYLTIPAGSEGKRVGNTHGLIMLASVASYGASLLMRQRRRRPSGLAAALSLAGVVGVLVGQWYGGHLVYHHGMRVKEGEESQARLPGDEALTRGLHRMERPVTERGPVMGAEQR